MYGSLKDRGDLSIICRERKNSVGKWKKERWQVRDKLRDDTKVKGLDLEKVKEFGRRK